MAERFLRAVIPYLTVKRERAVLALEFRYYCTGIYRIPTLHRQMPEIADHVRSTRQKRDEIAQKMKQLNKKGVSDVPR